MSNVPNYPVAVLIIFSFSWKKEFYIYGVELYFKACCSDGNVLPAAVVDILCACGALAMLLMSLRNWILSLYGSNLNSNVLPAPRAS